MVPANISEDIEFFAGVGKNIIKEKKSNPELVIIMIVFG
jgi:hypothetical protein